MKKQLLIFNIGLVFLIAVLNKIALNFFLYWRFWWFDILMHFLGGLWVGIIILWLYYYSGYIKRPIESKKYVFWLSVISVIIVGLGWEIFEFIIEVDFSNNYVGDTLLDLIMDTIGAVVAFWVIIKARIVEESKKNLVNTKIN